MSRLIHVVGMFAVLSVLGASQARAHGGQRPKPGPQEPVDRQAFPVRFVELGEVTTAPFTLPNGVPVDSSVGIVVRDLVSTKVDSSAKFRTFVPNAATGRHVILTASVSSLVLELAKFGIRFGYGPDGKEVESGGGGGNVNLEGNVDVNIGLLTMDFKMRDSDTGETYGAVSVDAATAGLNLGIKVKFSEISIGPEFIMNTPLKGAIQQITENAMRQMATQSRINFIPWVANVLAVEPDKGRVLFDAGQRAGVHPGDNFNVYSACQNSECFEYYQGAVKVMDTHEYSEAKVKDDPQGEKLRNMRAGDKVYIRFMDPKP